MLLRALVFIFAFNAIIPSAFAAGTMSGCDMDMMEKSSTLVVSSMPNPMSDMNCSMDDGSPCSLPNCINGCSAAVVPQLLFDTEYSLISVADHNKPISGFAYFYKIVHPVNTPPPLV